MTHPEALLIVDDTRAERRLMEITLGAAFPGAEILSASNPSQAKAMCEERHFDCVLLDYNMPEMDGLALAHQLKAGDAYLATVLMTSVGDEMLAAEALRSGVSDYIPKGRITAESIQRSVARSILACSQARVISQQRLELENFAYALAHDFKQPIRQITTFSMLIAEQLRDLRVGDVQRHLAFLTGAAARLGKLVDVMSQYTLLNQAPDLGDVDFGQVVEAVRSSLSPYLAERAGQFISPANLPTIRGNETLMIQVLQNLVVNGLRYNRSAAPHVELSATNDSGFWTIDLRDNGVGIEAAHLNDIFNPLVRLHNAAEYPGSGLGLTLARKAVISQNGTIWCESELGRGSVFRVRLPAADEAPGRSGAEQSEVLARASPLDRRQERTPPGQPKALPPTGARGATGERMPKEGEPEGRDKQAFGVKRRLESLSVRENGVLGGLIEGGSNKDIARDLGISPRTVEVYRANLMAKMRARNLADLVRMVVTVGGGAATRRNGSGSPSCSGRPRARRLERPGTAAEETLN